MAVNSVDRAGPHPLPAVDDAKDNAADVAALCDGAALLSVTGNRGASVRLLCAAVAISPSDLRAHRRLAAALANSGDIDAAADEYARYIEVALSAGDVGRAALEVEYARGTLFCAPVPLLAPQGAQPLIPPRTRTRVDRPHGQGLRLDLLINRLFFTILAAMVSGSLGAAFALGIGDIVRHR